MIFVERWVQSIWYITRNNKSVRAIAQHVVTRVTRSPTLLLNKMPHRSRSRSRDRYSRRRRDRSGDRSRDRSKDRSRSRSPDHQINLPNNASPIRESDYFKKFDELRLWLKEEKGKVCKNGFFRAKQMCS